MKMVYRCNHMTIYRLSCDERRANRERKPVDFASVNIDMAGACVAFTRISYCPASIVWSFDYLVSFKLAW